MRSTYAIETVILFTSRLEVFVAVFFLFLFFSSLCAQGLTKFPPFSFETSVVRKKRLTHTNFGDVQSLFKDTSVYLFVCLPYCIDRWED